VADCGPLEGEKKEVTRAAAELRKSMALQRAPRSSGVAQRELHEAV
jgi:hypothetical protein